MTLKIESTAAETKQGVPVNMSAVCQVKVKAHAEKEGEIDRKAIEKAAQNWLALSGDDLKDSMTSTMEGHQRQIMGITTVEDLYQKREQLAAHVREFVDSDLAKMGYECVSYVVTRLWDDNRYMASLGLTQTATVVEAAKTGKAQEEAKAKTSIAKANSERDVAVKEHETKASVAVKNKDQEVVEANKVYDLAKQAADKEINLKKAEIQSQVDQVQAEAAAVMGIAEAKQKVLLIEQEKMQEQKAQDLQVKITEKTVEVEAVKNEGTKNVELKVEELETKRKGVQAKGDAEALAIRQERDAQAKEVSAAHLAAATKIKANAEAEATEEVGKAQVNIARYVLKQSLASCSYSLWLTSLDVLQAAAKTATGKVSA